MQNLSRLKLLEGIKSELLDMEKDIEGIEDLEDAKRCMDNLAELWATFKVLNVEE